MKADEFTSVSSAPARSPLPTTPTAPKREPTAFFDAEHVELLLNRRLHTGLNIAPSTLNALVKTMSHDMETLERLLAPSSDRAKALSRRTARRIYRELKVSS